MQSLETSIIAGSVLQAGAIKMISWSAFVFWSLTSHTIQHIPWKGANTKVVKCLKNTQYIPCPYVCCNSLMRSCICWRSEVALRSSRSLFLTSFCKVNQHFKMFLAIQKTSRQQHTKNTNQTTKKIISTSLMERRSYRQHCISNSHSGRFINTGAHKINGMGSSMCYPVQTTDIRNTTWQWKQHQGTVT